MASPPCLGCILNSLSEKEKRCQKAHEPEHTTYVNESDPAYMGNLPLDELVSHIESTTKGKSKRRKFWKKKGKAEVGGIQEIPTEENEPEADEEPTAVETSKTENTAISHNCDNTDEVHSTVDHQMTKQPTTTTENAEKNKRKKKNKKAADPSTKMLELASGDAVQNGDEGLPTDEEYLKTFMTDKDYELFMKMMKDPRCDANPDRLREFKRKYPLQKLKELIRKYDELGDHNICLQEFVNLGMVSETNAKPKVVDTGFGSVGQLEVVSNAVITRSSGEIISDMEFTKALLADKELFVIAGMLTKNSYKYIHEVQRNYTLDYLKSLRPAFRDFESGVNPNAMMNVLRVNSLTIQEGEAIREKLKKSGNIPFEEDKFEVILNTLDQIADSELKRRSENGSGDTAQNTVLVRHETVYKYSTPQSGPGLLRLHSPHDPEEERDKVSTHSRIRLEAIKSKRNKKIKETNTVVVDGAAPGYVGNQSLVDILKHIENKPENNGKASNSGGNKKFAKSEEKEDVVESVVQSHQMMDKKEVVPIKENKKRTKKSPVELLCNKPTKKKELVSDDVVQKKLSHADNLTVKQHLEESAAASTKLVSDDVAQKAGPNRRRIIEDKLKDLPHDPVVKKYLLESPAQNASTKSHSLPETSVDPAENAIYGQVLKHYNMDKEKETVDLQKSEAPLRDPAEEKAWLEYSKRKNAFRNSRRSMENPHNGVFGRATQFDYSLFDLD